MYIIGSNTADDEIPKINDEVKTYIQNDGGILEKFEELGKKKLAYPVKKSKIGHYGLMTFSAPSDKINNIEHRIRTTPTVIRHLIINQDEALVRLEKDRVAQARLKLMRPKMETREETEPHHEAKPEKKIKIDLDAEIEKALESEDLTK